MLILQDLSHQKLARILLGKLWLIHDLSGVSMGRSWRSVLLETALLLFPFPDNLEVPEQWTWENLLEEARQRLKGSIPVQGELFSYEGQPLGSLTNYQLTRLLLVELQKWYAEDAQRPDPLKVEKEILEAAVALIHLPEEHVQFPVRDLIDEAQERYRTILATQRLYTYC